MKPFRTVRNVNYYYACTISERRRPASLCGAALSAAAAGLPVFRLRPREKRPLRAGWQREATTDPEQIHWLWADAPEANVGVLCRRGLFVVDTDSDEAEARVRALSLHPTPTVVTPRGRTMSRSPWNFGGGPELTIRP